MGLCGYVVSKKLMKIKQKYFNNYKNYYLTLIIDFIGYAVFYLKKKYKSINLRKINKLLIIKYEHLGDVSLIYPIIENIKKENVNVKIDVVVGSWVKPLINENPFIHKIYYIDNPMLNRTKKQKISDYYYFIKKLLNIKKEYDLTIFCTANLLQMLSLLLIKSKYKLGYAYKGGGFLLTNILEYKDNYNIFDLHINFIKYLQIINIDKRLKLYFKNDDIKNYFVENNNNILINPTAGYSIKEWSNEKFIELINKLLIQYSEYNIIIMGTEDKNKKILNIIKNFDSKRIINLCGKLTVKQLFYLFKSIKLYIGMDSFPRYIAAHYNIPSFIIRYGGDSHNIWGKLFEKETVFYKIVECYPCGKHYCNNKNKCLELIEVNEIIEKLKIYL